MRVFKLSAPIGHDRRLVIQLPIDVPEGAAKVIVSFPSIVPNETLRRRHLENLLQQPAGAGNAARSEADIDRQPAEGPDCRDK